MDRHQDNTTSTGKQGPEHQDHRTLSDLMRDQHQQLATRVEQSIQSTSSSSTFQDQDPLQESARGSVDRYRLLSQMALLGMAEEKVREADALMRQAEQLEESSKEPLPTLERRLLLGKLHLRRGKTAEALACFASVRPEAQALLPSARILAFVGEYLETLVLDDRSTDLQLLLSLVDQVLELIWRAQPALPPQVTRRPLESAMGALISAVEEHGVDSQTGQRLLRKTWCFILGVRREPRNVHPPSDSGMEQEVLPLIEADFSLALSRAVLDGAEGEGWKEAWLRLQSFTQRTVERNSRDWRKALEIPQWGVSLALFSFTALLRSPLLLVLGAANGRLGMKLVPEAEQLSDEYRRALVSAGEPSARGLEEELPKEAFGLLLPEGLSRMLAPNLAESNVVPFPSREHGGSQERSSVSPWTIYPDEHHRDLPFELMRVSDDRPELMGEALPLTVAIGLRAPPNARPRLERGWVGFYEEDRRAAAESEGDLLKGILQLIEGMGFPAQLKENSLTVQALWRLQENPPSILHISAPAFAEQDFSEASGLVLSGRLYSSEESLLSYRRICELDLRGIELVVLSGAVGTVSLSSRIGASSSLAQAFLLAGASQVITGRLPRIARSARRWLLAFYRHLVERTTAEALALARGDSIRSHGRRADCAAWCLWC